MGYDTRNNILQMQKILMCRFLIACILFSFLSSCASTFPKASLPNSTNQGPHQLVLSGYEEPLLHLPSPLYTPLRRPAETAGSTAIERLLEYLALNRNTPWEASIQLNLGLAYYRNGYFSNTFPAFERAWRLSRTAIQPAAKALADRAFGELVRMHARLGHARQLESLLQSVQGRPFTGPATEAVAGAREGLWMMRHRPGISYLCGAKALYSLLDWQQPGAQGLAILDAYRSGENGIQLSQLATLAQQAGMKVRPVFGHGIPVPSVIHWKVNHYAAILEKQGDWYHVKDPTFGSDLWLTEPALRSQASGYFLVPESSAANWQSVSRAQAEQVYGQGYTASSDPDRTTPCDQVKSKAPCDGSQPIGMAHYDVHTMLVSLNLTDTPLSYTPPLGHRFRFTMRYNQREANQPANFSFGNLGPKWTHNWLTYIEDSPMNAGAVVNRIVAGGGAMKYGGYHPGSGEYLSRVSDRARLFRVSSDPIVYERRLPSGAKEVYSVSDGAVSGIRRVFLSRKIDASGHATTLEYDARLRLTRVVDALGQATVFAYEHPADDLLITRVTDPFGRQVLIEYDDLGRLVRITDPVGMVSAFTYDGGHFLTALDTPYGRTRFAYRGDGTSRTLVITDPLGAQERVEYGQALGIPRFVRDAPSGDILTRNKWHDFRNTAYWDKQTYRDHGRDVTKAEVSHWLHTSANQTSGLLETFKKPLENRIWYNYPGQTDPIRETHLTQAQHSRIGRVLDDGTSQIFIRAFNDYGKLVYQADPMGNHVRYHYADNQIDLLQITRLRGGSEETVATFRWDDHHHLLSATDGKGNTITYTYNDAGQLLSQTNALGHVTGFDYDPRGYLVQVTHPSGKTEQFGYDEVGRLATYTDTFGHTRTHLYDALNRRVRTVYEDGTAIEYTWDKLDLVRVRDRLGRVTRYEYDALRRKVAETDPGGRQTRYTYDASGRLLSITNPLGQVTGYEYDLQGRRIAEIDAEGHRTDYVYERTTARLARVVDAEGGVTRYAYDLANRLIAVTDPNQHTTGYRLDEVGNLLAQISPDRGTTLYQYDVLGNPVRKTDARGVTTDYHYDALNRLQQIQTPDSAYDIEFSYDGANYGAEISSRRRRLARGKRTGMRDSSGHTRWYYNLNGDIARIDTFFHDLDGVWSQRFGYDYGYEPGTGRLIRYRYPNGHAFRYHYNHGRIQSIDRVVARGVTPVVTGVEYHPTGGIAAFTYGNGLAYQRRVDALGRVTELSVDKVFHRQWRYTPAGNIASIDDWLDGAESRSYVYDPLHRLIEATGPTRQSYRYDPGGNRLRRNDALYSIDPDSNRLLAVIGLSRSLQFQYDAAGNRLRQITGTGNVLSYEYDPHNRLVQVVDDTGEVASYQYNGLGQRVIKRTAKGTEYSLYSPQGQRIAVLGTDGSLRHHILYWNSRPLARYQVRYRFTSRRGKGTASLSVALAKHRLKLTRYDSSVLDVVIGDHLWQVKQSGKDTVYQFAVKAGRYLRLKGHIHLGPNKRGVAHLLDRTQKPPQTFWLKGGRKMEVYYYHLDHLGTPQLMTNQNQDVVWQARYTPFGQTTPLTRTLHNNLRFPGQYHDQETGLYYNYFRYYDPNIGRYITSDPIGLMGGVNSYSYAYNNSIINVDPLGLFCLMPQIIDILAAGAGGAVGGAMFGGGIPGAIIGFSAAATSERLNQTIRNAPNNSAMIAAIVAFASSGGNKASALTAAMTAGLAYSANKNIPFSNAVSETVGGFSGGFIGEIIFPTSKQGRLSLGIYGMRGGAGGFISGLTQDMTKIIFKNFECKNEINCK